MADFNEVIKDPDFWHQDTTDDDRKAVLSAVDKKFAQFGVAEKDRFIKNMSETRQKNEKAQTDEKQARIQTIAPEAMQKQSMWEQMVAPVTQAVGRGLEVATEPLVGAARMLKGEGVGAAFGPETFTASHPPTANQAASGIVPQSPWQAGAMAAQAIPGAGAIPGLAKLGPAVSRVGASAMGAGGLQGLLGSQGLLEGGANVAGEALTGAAKGAGTQLAGEALGKVMGGAGRVARGRNKVIQQGDVRNMTRTASEIAPEFPAKRTVQEAGEFFTGTPAAGDAAQAALKGKVDRLEQTLLATQGHPYIDTVGLRDSYAKVLKQAQQMDPTLVGEIMQLAPAQYGFLPEQAIKLVGLVRQNLNPAATGWGHMKQDAVNTLVKEIEASLARTTGGIGSPATGQFTAAREGYAKSSGLKELLEGAFKPGKKGYQFDIHSIQTELAKNPDLAKRFSPSELEKLIRTSTRGASGKPGMADVPAGASTSVPSTMGKQGMIAAFLRNLLKTGRHVGELPGTLPAGAKAGLGVATSAAAGQRRKED